MFDLTARLRLIDDMTRPLRRVMSVTGAFSASMRIGSLSMALLTGATAVAATKMASSALKLASDAEQAGIAFETMLGSADKAKQLLGDLSDFANSTPFELPQVRDASKKLLAFGFEAKSIIPMMTGIGNAASGLGLGGEGINRITIALGQMKAKSKVSGDEIKLAA